MSATAKFPKCACGSLRRRCDHCGARGAESLDTRDGRELRWNALGVTSRAPRAESFKGASTSPSSRCSRSANFTADRKCSTAPAKSRRCMRLCPSAACAAACACAIASESSRDSAAASNASRSIRARCTAATPSSGALSFARLIRSKTSSKLITVPPFDAAASWMRIAASYSTTASSCRPHRTYTPAKNDREVARLMLLEPPASMVTARSARATATSSAPVLAIKCA
mmetsp:Transcript_2507/g.7390  ORF Transcript_2507/g.7390 Transcript_2507/m.7390 type:complete len:227 (-) Transcript_2507:312-992(-)